MKDLHEESYQRLLQIEKAITEIEKYVEGETIDSFCKKNVLHDAVLMQFIIIGEAIIHIEERILNKYNYHWHKVRRFRNLIAHEYFNITFQAVWQIIENDLQELKILIQTMLKEEF